MKASDETKCRNIKPEHQTKGKMKRKTKKNLLIGGGIALGLIGLGILVKRKYDKLPDIKKVGDARDLNECARLQNITRDEAGGQSVKLKADVVYEVSAEETVKIRDTKGNLQKVDKGWILFTPVDEAVRLEYDKNQASQNIVTAGPKKKILKGSKPWVFENLVTNGKVVLKEGEKMDDFCLRKKLNPVQAFKQGAKSVVANIPLEGEK